MEELISHTAKAGEDLPVGVPPWAEEGRVCWGLKWTILPRSWGRWVQSDAHLQLQDTRTQQQTMEMHLVLFTIFA